MRWEPDISRGEWLRSRLEDEWSTTRTMHIAVPRGFDRYVRIFHRTRPTTGSWNSPPVAWHVVAQTHGAPTHPLMSWHDINRLHDLPDHHGPLPTAEDFHDPDFARLEVDQLAAIAGHLTRHTCTPDHGVAAVWDGFGDLFVRQYGSSWTVVGGPPPDAIPGLGDREFYGPRLHLPHRDYVLFDAGSAEFTATWAQDAPWAHGSHPQSPSILWPEDRSWVLVSEIDWTSTIVGGPVELMAPLLTDPAVDGAMIPAGSVLTGFG